MNGAEVYESTRRGALGVLLLAGLGMGLATPSFAQDCPEPSSPFAVPFVPLTVARDSGGALQVAWDDVADEHVHFRGSLASLRDGRWSHVPVLATAGAEALVDSRTPDAYFLVTARCPGGQGSLGGGSLGDERPLPGRLRVTVSMTGEGEGVGLQVSLGHPLTVSSWNENLLPIGPFTEGSPGNPVTVVNANRFPTRLLVVTALFGFPAEPFSPPADVYEIQFADFGLADPEQIEVLDCVAADANGLTVDSIGCELTVSDEWPWP